MRGFATGVGAKADIGAAGADPTLVYEYTTQSVFPFGSLRYQVQRRRISAPSRISKDRRRSRKLMPRSEPRIAT